MKYINKNIEKLDSQIQDMFDLDMPNSAFKRVIPTNMMGNLRTQYVDFSGQTKFAQNSNQNSRAVSTQVIKVNIAPLREAGYCICPEELAAVCEQLLKQQNESTVSHSTSDMNNVSEQKIVTPVETSDSEIVCDHDTTGSKSIDCTSEVCDIEKLAPVNKQKVYPAKIASDVSKANSDKNVASHQVRTKKRKYFTKYMSNEFSKDVSPVTMGDMDAKTQQLFSQQEYNELVSEITGMN
jgi:hypothetical protein